MKILSLFDGVAGARQALKELNIDCEYYASEIDKYAIQVSKANHPDIVHIGDVKNIDIYNDWGDTRAFKVNEGCPFNAYDQDVSEIDLLIGGSPCQDLSIANKERKGLQGERSGLFYEYLRILNEVKPKYFILENVNSMAKAAKETITKELFDIEPIMINFALVTAQNRKRLYWVGELINGEYKQVKIDQPKDKEIYLKDVIEHGDSQLVFACAQRGRNIVKGKRKDVKGAKTEQRLETIYSEKSNCLTKVQKDSLIVEDMIVRKLTPKECCRLQGFPDNYVSMVSKTQGYKAMGNSFTVPVIKHLIKSIL